MRIEVIIQQIVSDIDKLGIEAVARVKGGNFTDCKSIVRDIYECEEAFARVQGLSSTSYKQKIVEAVQIYFDKTIQ